MKTKKEIKEKLEQVEALRDKNLEKHNTKLEDVDNDFICALEWVLED